MPYFVLVYGPGTDPDNDPPTDGSGPYAKSETAAMVARSLWADLEAQGDQETQIRIEESIFPPQFFEALRKAEDENADNPAAVAWAEVVRSSRLGEPDSAPLEPELQTLIEPGGSGDGAGQESPGGHGRPDRAVIPSQLGRSAKRAAR